MLSDAKVFLHATQLFLYATTAVCNVPVCNTSDDNVCSTMSVDLHELMCYANDAMSADMRQYLYVSMQLTDHILHAAMQYRLSRAIKSSGLFASLSSWMRSKVFGERIVVVVVVLLQEEGNIPWSFLVSVEPYSPQTTVYSTPSIIPSTFPSTIPTTQPTLPPTTTTTPPTLPPTTTTMAPITYPPVTYQPVTPTPTIYTPYYEEENPCQQCMGACMNECTASGQSQQQCQEVCTQNCAPACGSPVTTPSPQIYEPVSIEVSTYKLRC
ncbi:unnamed protein product [Strongylus vulgaris]|uniref:Uncharacterized protein n=1 Tax=Strongylus vulgaris TaxID=40348 RepID=A0A3P7I052_STRVU|nr:unnamed protein product [Strongylus vulgaris]